ncbi:MAG: 2Fe-2S iron-sulfur cluster-binding protein [Spirochaetales bacterium]
MAKITYVQPDGTKETLDVENGTTVMQAAIDNGIDGIEAACGGLAMCATCHVYVDEAFLEKLPEPSDEEDEMLDSAAADRLDNSRLSCQLEVDDSLDGIVVQIPETQ